MNCIHRIVRQGWQNLNYHMEMVKINEKSNSPSCAGENRVGGNGERKCVRDQGFHTLSNFSPQMFMPIVYHPIPPQPQQIS